MPLIDERRADIPRGRILYDAAQLCKADERLFSLEAWAAKGAAEQLIGGRGSIALLEHEGARWALRHYRRGGMIASFSQERYLWLGEDCTRSFMEFRLLATLRRLGLPVPKPIAARYERHGLTYSADLMTEWIADTETLAKALLSSDMNERSWREIGRTIAAFHAAGVHHADLNANNILLRARSSTDATDHAVYILDFDRGRVRARGSWEQQVLARLRRSLEKISAKADQSFDESQWDWLIEGYQAGEQ
jgi:3-deoxy-D-manno-octulosonic acid kinase